MLSCGVGNCHSSQKIGGGNWLIVNTLYTYWCVTNFLGLRHWLYYICRSQIISSNFSCKLLVSRFVLQWYFGKLIYLANCKIFKKISYWQPLFLNSYSFQGLLTIQKILYLKLLQVKNQNHFLKGCGCLNLQNILGV